MIPIATDHNQPQERIGAIVLGGDYQGLGVVRSLGRHGIPVCVIDDERSIARYSRYTLIAQRVSSLLEEKDTVSALLEFGQTHKLQGWIIYPTRDEQVAAISQNREVLSKMFRVPTPDWETVKVLWDKCNTYRLAEKLKISTPRTWYPSKAADLAQVGDNFPVVLKPAIKEHFIYATKRKAWRADNLTQLQELFERAQQIIPVEEIMIQDMIPGDGSCQFSFCSFFKQGKSIAHLTACRKRQHPLDFGRSSTYVETVDLPILVEYAQRFLREIDYYGLVEVEFKLDPRDGEYRLLDVNGRTWGYHMIGRPSGVDFSYLLYNDQLGEPPIPCAGKAGVRWVHLLTDVPTGILGILQGQLESRAYVRSLRACDAEAVFSLDDPLPGIMELTMVPYLFLKRGF